MAIDPIVRQSEIVGVESIEFHIPTPLDIVERNIIIKTYERFYKSHSKEQIATILGISVRNLYAKLKLYEKNRGR